MNEYEYTFLQDCREKKRTASGAYHRATRGKHTFTVHNPTDYLTPKQRKELSGPVTTFKDYPYTYEELMAMPEEQRNAYLRFVVEKYDIPATELAKIMGVGRNTIGKRMQEAGVDTKTIRKPNDKKREIWAAFLAKREAAPETAETIKANTEPETITEETLSETISEVQEKATVSAFHHVSAITITGRDKKEIKDETSRLLTFVLPDHQNYKITIETL